MAADLGQLAAPFEPADIAAIHQLMDFVNRVALEASDRKPLTDIPLDRPQKSRPITPTEERDTGPRTANLFGQPRQHAAIRKGIHSQQDTLHRPGRIAPGQNRSSQFFDPGHFQPPRLLQVSQVLFHPFVLPRSQTCPD